MPVALREGYGEYEGIRGISFRLPLPHRCPPSHRPLAPTDEACGEGILRSPIGKQNRGRGLCIPVPVFSLRPFPRAFFYARYSEQQFDIRVPVGFVFISCIPCDDVIVRLFCVVYFPTVEKVESSYGASPGGVQYIGAVSSCSPLIPIHPLLPASPFPSFSFQYTVSVRLAHRLARRLVMPSRFVRYVASCCPSCRRLGSFRPSARPICRLGLSSRSAPFRSAVRSFSFRLSGRSCRAFPCRLVFVLASCLVIASRRLISFSSCHLVLRLLVGVSDPFSFLVPVFAPFRPARRSFLTHFVRPSRFMSSVVGRGRVVMAMGRRGLLFSSHPPPHGSLLATHSLVAGWRREDVGYGAPFHAARRSLFVRSCPIVPLHHVGSTSPSLCSHPLIREAGKRMRRAIERERENNTDRNETHDETKGTRRASETRMGGDDTRQASNETTDETKGTRRGTRRHLTESKRQRRRGWMEPFRFL